jgi:DNA-binding CsgD family transcriptional regulator
MIAARLSPGAISESSSSHLPPSEASKPPKPVMFPPGWLRRGTMPRTTGSSRLAKTIGIARVSRWRATLGAVQLVISGGVYIPPQALPGQEQAPSAPAGMPHAAGARPVSPADFGLTERQMDVLALITRGKSNKAICRVLDLSEPTVKSHIGAILRALRRRGT